MKLQTISQAPKVSSAKLGVYCAIFCLATGLVYGWLESMSYPVNSFSKGWMAFSTTLFWGGAIVSFVLFKNGRKHAPLVLLAVYAINIVVSVLAVNDCNLANFRVLLPTNESRVESGDINSFHRGLRDFISTPNYYDPQAK